MRKFHFIGSLLLAGAAGASHHAGHAQSSPYEKFRSQNASMAEVQPGWMGPLIQSDIRLSQVVRVSVSDLSVPGAQIISYGNNHGISVLAARRFQFDFDPPAYFRNHSATMRDGFGNATVQAKYRIASGNAEHGDFAVTAIASEGFAGNAYQNGMLSSYYCPKLGAGKGFGRWNTQSLVSGTLPTSKAGLQGRDIEWSTTVQFHATPRSWFDVEDNSAFFFGGSADGMKQNFLTPAAYYLVRRKGWEPAHSSVVFNAGMQIATSRYHQYNHNLITEMRVLF